MKVRSISNKVREANNIISKLERIAVEKDVDVNVVHYLFIMVNDALCDIGMIAGTLTMRECARLKVPSRWGLSTEPDKWLEDYKQSLNQCVERLCRRNDMIKRPQMETLDILSRIMNPTRYLS